MSWEKAINDIAERRKSEHDELQTKLGEPHAFVPSPEDARFGYGYWKAEGGVIRYTKYVTGFDPFSRVEFPDDMIDVLVKVRGS